MELLLYTDTTYSLVRNQKGKTTMYHNVEKQFTFNLPSPFPCDLLFEVECVFTFDDGEKVKLETYDSSLGKRTFEYKDCGDTAKNMLYGWHLCSDLVFASSLILFDLKPLSIAELSSDGNWKKA